jgi:hypothetical protein
MKRKLLLITLTATLAATASCSFAKQDDVDSANTVAMLGLLSPPQSEVNCFNCHSDSSELGQKILSAQAGYEHSVHANGPLAPIFTGLYTVTDGTVTTAYNTTTAYMQKAVGYESHGSNAFYANGSGCQICHTHEGFVKKVNGLYADADAEDADFITNPSPIGCFTCHAPHTNGDFTLRVADGTTVTTAAGASYAKAKGNICASCHVARLSGNATGLAYVLAGATGTSGSLSSRLGPHHSPTTDMLLGKGGAESSYQTYSSHVHGSGDATCVGCHMTMPEARAGFAPGIGGHSFAAGGVVHGTANVNTNGCNVTACHNGAISDPAAEEVTGTSTTKLKVGGHIWYGDATPFKSGVAVASQNAAIISALLTQLADPANGCAGLLSTYAAANSVGTFTFAKDTLGNTDGRCVLGYSISKATAPVENDPLIRVAKAIYNYRFITEDKSFGVHNPTYVRQLLFDDITNLDGTPGSARP